MGFFQTRIMMVFILILSTLLSNVALSPIFDFNDDHPSGPRNYTTSTRIGQACDSGENFRSDDPCLPWCICKTEGRRGRRVCAKIKCSTAEMSDHCRLIQAEGHCCPKILCETSNLTTSALYNLPWIVLPPDMFEMNSVIPEGSSN